jgi:UDP-GlcNAc:undecaprenyl-phosphate GlcNAc-1-phosphate transferase
MGGNLTVATGLAALSGACLGFLRYNFNPASIFMGDSGSYFLGYMLAALSVLGSMKSQATAAILIPVIALGFPIMDALLSPLRRFIIGKALFYPDKNHIHHKLIQKGLSHRNTVLLLYGATIFLGIFSLLLVNAQERRAAIVLVATGACIFIAIHKLGYLEYIAVDKILGYLHDITDVMGLRKERRSFLSHQIEIEEAADIDELWTKLVETLILLKIDQAEIRFNKARSKGYVWKRGKPDQELGNSDKILCIDLPLLEDYSNYGTLKIRKDLRSDPLRNSTLRRIELLRRSLVHKLKDFEKTVKGANQRPAFDHHWIFGPRLLKDMAEFKKNSGA